ncbi:MAG: 4-phosphopantoate--beta-alanine ligase [Candidatus Nezhaarchaeales archaeon]
MSEEVLIPPTHPRAESLRIRERLISSFRRGVVAASGLIAHGRGEAFDYLIGEQTIEPARKAIRAAAAYMLMAKRPVISVNGNAAALVAKELVELSKATNAKLEVNLFYRSRVREELIERTLKEAGASEVLGVGDRASAVISELMSERRRVDPEGILIADLVLVPLEDGDRTMALVRMGKTVIAIDLNPLSRTSQWATVTITDNVVRAIPLLVKEVLTLKGEGYESLKRIVNSFDNKRNLNDVLAYINARLSKLSSSKELIDLPKSEV